MKNVIRTAVVSAVAAAFVASVAIAGGHQQNRDQQRGPQFGQGPQGRRGGPGGPGGPGRGGPLGVPFQELTDAQREQVKAIMEAEREDGPPAEGKLRQALESELLADAPNDGKIAELSQQINAASAEQLAKHIAIQRKINQVLTAEQRAKARERIANRIENGPRGRRGGGGRH